MCPTASAPHARLICLLICFSLLAQFLLPVSAGASSPDALKSRLAAGRASAAQETDAANLPDLDVVRTRPAYEPKAVPPVPSTRRRCSPGNPRCNDDIDSQPSPTPTASPTPSATSTPAPSPTPSPSPAQTPSPSPSPTASPTPAALPTPTVQLTPPAPASLTAWPHLASVSTAASEDRHWLDLRLLDFYTGAGYSVSDSPARLLPPARYAAAPIPEPAALYQSQGRVNVARASNGGMPSASSTHSAYSLSAVNDGDRKGPGFGGVWGDATSNVYPDWVQFDFAGAKVIDEVALFSVQNNGFGGGSIEPTQTMTGSQYVVTSFEVQYWTGTTWATVSGGNITGNNLIWRRATFPEVTTTKVRVVINATADNYSQVPEIEVWGREAPRVNYALALNGATVAASSQYGAAYPVAAAINGDRKGTGYGAGGAWADATSDAYPDWLEVSFGGERRIDEVDVIGLQEAYANPSEPTQAMTGRFALTDLQVQYWNGSAWAIVSGGSVTGNDKVWRRFTFPEVLTTKVRVWVTRVAGDNHSQVVELEAWGPESLPPGTGLTGEYYDNLDFTGYVMTRSDAAVNFDWGGGSPASSIGADDFSVRWTGTVVPRYTESYIFYATSDDGVRLWIDGQLVIDRWQNQSPYEAASAPLTLEAGRHYAVRMEYYEHVGGASAWLKWSSASQAKEVVPQTRLYGCWKGSDQFTKDCFLGALWRQPSAAELQDWAGRLNQAQGDYQLLTEAQSLGAQVFTSAEYAARNRTDAEYVADLYWAYLQRAPDAGGLSWWTSQITSCGSDQTCRQIKRAEVRGAFNESPEFAEKIRNLCGTAAASSVNGGTGYNFSTARLDPANRTGSGGVDAYSRNFNFSIPLVSLAGRAGLDLGLTLSYNSLVWTKDSTGVTFDADQGFPSPGFRLGFPTVEPKFINPQLQQSGQPTRYSYLLVTPGGARVELRQVGTSNVYESANSSYLQLTEADMTLRSTDGTRLSFILLNGSYRCHEVKDSNGNYLSVAYYGDGRIDKVIDTLGRAVTFNYDNFQNLISLTQPWTREGEPGVTPAPTPDESHVWATFGYENRTLQPSFSNLAVIGEQPGTIIPVVSQVGLDDGSFYRFKYNEWGQVWKVTHYAADSAGANNESHPLTSTRLDLPGSDLLAASPQTDCPRFKEERTWIEYGVMGQNAEVVTKYDEWAANMASCVVTLPDNTTKQVSNYHTSADGWKKGLTASEEVTSGGQTVRTTTLTWEHDGGADASYSTNPRVTQTSITDPLTQPQPRTRTARVTYTIPSDFQGESGYTGMLNVSLPKRVEECADSNCSDVRRTIVTDYKVPNLGQYVVRRILGLARYQYLYEGAESAGNLRSQVGYLYDELNDPNDPQNKFLTALSSPASQHDGTNYGQVPDANGQGGLRWRGNANRVRRYSVDQSNGTLGGYVESRVGFNVTGTAAYTKDAAGHKSSVSYTDSFYQNVNRTHPDPAYRLQTYAYPTVVTDPDGFTAGTSYNYDMGAAREARTPLPNVTTNQPGPLSRLYYDAAGRLVRSLSVDSGAYTRVVYPAKMDAAQTYTLLEAGVETYSAQIFDGAGRTRATARNLPGSAGGYAGQRFDFDSMGRLARQSNPTETNAAASGWVATGDDAANGWLYTQTSYDWKGRPQVVTAPKLNPNDPNEQPATRVFEYGGCGCAGGEVVTLTDEAGRRQKVYSDPLGRRWKTEVLNSNGSVYSTVTNTYNALDQVTEVKEQAGTNGAAQLTTMTYDGYGRLKTRHLPRYDAGATVTYEYDADDVPLTMTDPRGVVTTYGYTNAAGYTNKRHLVNSVTYSNAPTGVPVPAQARFEYDAAGNRTSMTDGTGSVSYSYNTLSQLTSEARQFTGLSGHTYTTTYNYTVSGQLKYVIDPAGSRVDYEYDMAGRMLNVMGSGPASSPSYASNLSYRAWGALKDVDYGNDTHQFFGYDTRLRAATMELRNVIANVTNQTPLTMKWNYDYYADGRVNHTYDLNDNRFDRKLDYDDKGRLKEAYTGLEARGQAPTDPPNSPFRQTFGYDAWGNMTARAGRLWKQELPGELSEYGTDNRRDGWEYDAVGHLTESDSHLNEYDAAGSQTYSHPPAAGECGGYDYEIKQAYDGEGRPASRVQTRRTVTGGEPPQVQCATAVEESYYLYAAALGGAQLMELNATGAKVKGYVYGGGSLLAQQELYPVFGSSGVKWRHSNPGSASWVETTANRVFERQEMDPLGAEVGTVDPFLITPTSYADSHTDAPLFVDGGDPFHLSDGCGDIDGMPASCSEISERTGNGTAVYEEWGGRFRAVPRRAMAPPAADPSAGGRTPDTVWVDRWEDCSRPGVDEVCQRNVGFFQQLPGAGGPLSTQLTSQPGVIYHDTVNFKKQLQEVLAYGDCNEFVSKMLRLASDKNGGKNNAVATDIMSLYKMINSQGRGGFRHNFKGTWRDQFIYTDKGPYYSQKSIAGGGGLMWGRWKDQNVTVWICAAKSYEDTRPSGIAAMKAQYFVTAIHEIFHAGGENSSYGHELMDEVARELDGDNGIDFDRAVKKYCLPSNLR